jgi:diguanylate cyclase (GGDEF)-like protein/PAS domain S-box-containing protein
MTIEVVAAYSAVVLAFAAFISVHLSHVRGRRKMIALLDDYNRAQMASRETESRLRLLLSQVPAMLWTVDRALRVTSIAGAGLVEQRLSEDGAVGAAIDSLMTDEEHRRASVQALQRAIEGEAVRYESRSNGRWLQSDVEPLLDDAGEIVGATAVMLDVTEIRESAERFAILARQDALTGLPNRLALDERLPNMLEHAVENEESLAVLFVDVDRFKTINDTLGHRIGDVLLKDVAARLQSRLNLHATIFRPGGDEFVVVVQGIKHKRTVASVAMDVLDAFSEPFDIDGRELFVTASVGTSIFPQNAETPDELVAFADSAMYRAKESGRNNAKFYDGTMHAHVLERMGLEQDLRQALARNELTMLYQPVVEVATRQIIGAEALLRWHHPLLGELLPGAFVPIAEETGIIVDISRWVLQHACSTAATIRAGYAADFRIAINMSPRDFYEQDFSTALSGALNEAQLPASAVDLEVTENVLLNDLAVGTLARIHSMGVKVVVDDFGTGYSSLGYIKKLPVSAIKIDKGFIDDVTRDPYDQGIVKAILALGQTLGLRVIAEGIESEGQWDFIRSVRCDHAQGYFFHHPMRKDDLIRTIVENHQDRRAGSRIIPLYGTR